MVNSTEDKQSSNDLSSHKNTSSCNDGEISQILETSLRSDLAFTSSSVSDDSETQSVGNEDPRAIKTPEKPVKEDCTTPEKRKLSNDLRDQSLLNKVCICLERNSVIEELVKSIVVRVKTTEKEKLAERNDEKPISAAIESQGSASSKSRDLRVANQQKRDVEGKPLQSPAAPSRKSSSQSKLDLRDTSTCGPLSKKLRSSLGEVVDGASKNKDRSGQEKGNVNLGEKGAIALPERLDQKGEKQKSRLEKELMSLLTDSSYEMPKTSRRLSKVCLQGDQRAPVTFDCCYCDFKATTKYFLHVHLEKHKTSNKFPCNVCPFVSDRKSRILRHVRRHEECLFACNMCSYRCKSTTKLSRHQLQHKSLLIHQCHLCDTKVKSSWSLKRHILRFHRRDKVRNEEPLKKGTSESPATANMKRKRPQSPTTSTTKVNSSTLRKRIASKALIMKSPSGKSSRIKNSLKSSLREHLSDSPKITYLKSPKNANLTSTESRCSVMDVNSSTSHLMQRRGSSKPLTKVSASESSLLKIQSINGNDSELPTTNSKGSKLPKTDSNLPASQNSESKSLKIKSLRIKSLKIKSPDLLPQTAMDNTRLKSTRIKSGLTNDTGLKTPITKDGEGKSTITKHTGLKLAVTKDTGSKSAITKDSGSRPTITKDTGLSSSITKDIGSKSDRDTYSKSAITADTSPKCYKRKNKGPTSPLKNTTPAVCVICRTQFVSTSKLNRHMEIHLDIKKVICPICPYRCRQVNSMKGHFNNIHGGGLQNRLVNCKFCNFETKNLIDMMYHFKCHPESQSCVISVKKYACLICYMSYRSKMILMDHMIVNHGVDSLPIGVKDNVNEDTMLSRRNARLRNTRRNEVKLKMDTEGRMENDREGNEVSTVPQSREEKENRKRKKKEKYIDKRKKKRTKLMKNMESEFTNPTWMKKTNEETYTNIITDKLKEITNNSKYTTLENGSLKVNENLAEEMLILTMLAENERNSKQSITKLTQTTTHTSKNEKGKIPKRKSKKRAKENKEVIEMLPKISEMTKEIKPDELSTEMMENSGETSVQVTEKSRETLVQMTEKCEETSVGTMENNLEDMSVSMTEYISEEISGESENNSTPELCVKMTETISYETFAEMTETEMTEAIYDETSSIKTKPKFSETSAEMTETNFGETSADMTETRSAETYVDMKSDVKSVEMRENDSEKISEVPLEVCVREKETDGKKSTEHKLKGMTAENADTNLEGTSSEITEMSGALSPEKSVEMTDRNSDEKKDDISEEKKKNTVSKESVGDEDTQDNPIKVLMTKNIYKDEKIDQPPANSESLSKMKIHLKCKPGTVENIKNIKAVFVKTVPCKLKALPVKLNTHITGDRNHVVISIMEPYEDTTEYTESTSSGALLKAKKNILSNNVCKEYISPNIVAVSDKEYGVRYVVSIPSTRTKPSVGKNHVRITGEKTDPSVLPQPQTHLEGVGDSLKKKSHLVISVSCKPRFFLEKATTKPKPSPSKHLNWSEDGNVNKKLCDLIIIVISHNSNAVMFGRYRRSDGPLGFGKSFPPVQKVGQTHITPSSNMEEFKPIKNEPKPEESGSQMCILKVKEHKLENTPTVRQTTSDNALNTPKTPPKIDSNTPNQKPSTRSDAHKRRRKSEHENSPIKKITKDSPPSTKKSPHFTPNECNYECRYCEFGTDKLFRLNLHLIVHRDQNPFECSFCPSNFALLVDLRTHMRQHADEEC